MPEDAPVLAGVRVLVIDDERLVRDGVRALLYYADLGGSTLTLPFSRRRFMQLCAAAGAGTVIGCDGGSEPTGQVLIIGSGFGGSIAALRLAEAGYTSTVLERGMRWEITEERDTFTTLALPDRRSGWLTRETPVATVPRRIPRFTGLLEKVSGDTVNVVVGAGVGGGSLAYAGMFVQPPQALFEAAFPSDISYSELAATHYPRVQAMMRTSTIPDDVLASEPYLSTRVFLEQAAAAGIEAGLVQSGMDWDIIRAEVQGDIPPEATLGEYIYGMNSGAKRSTDRLYLRQAEDTGRCEVRPLHQVRTIGLAADGSYEVIADRIDTAGEVLETLTFSAPVLILAAGSIGSTKLLMRARRDSTIPSLSAEIGQGWGNNGQHLLVRGNLSVETGITQGGPACSYMHYHDNPVGPLGVEFGPAPFGFEHNCLINPSSGIPDSFGQLVLNADDEINVEWPAAAGATSIAAAEHSAEVLNTANGGEILALPIPGLPNVFHPLGGVVMGRACDTYGRVDGQRFLYVVDGAIIPGVTPGVEPRVDDRRDRGARDGRDHRGRHAGRVSHGVRTNAQLDCGQLFHGPLMFLGALGAGLRSRAGRSRAGLGDRGRDSRRRPGRPRDRRRRSSPRARTRARGARCGGWHAPGLDRAGAVR